MQLRPYQQNACSDLWQTLQAGENALLSAPCAAGKSMIIAAILAKLIETIPGFRALVLIDREVLARQLAETINEITGKKSGSVCSSVSIRKDYSRQITIASRQTLINGLDKLGKMNILVLDEVHLVPMKNGKSNQYGTIIDHVTAQNPKCRIMGVTATPYRLGDGYIYGNRHKEGLTPFFKRLSHRITYHELMDNNFLAPLNGRIADDLIKTDDINMVAGEFNLGQLSRAAALHVDTAVQALDTYGFDRKHVIVFAVDISHVEKLVNAFNESLIPAVGYHSNLTKIEKEGNLQAFLRGDIRVIVSVGMLAIGFDAPFVDCAIMARPTMSPSLCLQMLGRILRVSPGKGDALLIELTENSTTHLQQFDLDRPVVKVPLPSGPGDAPFKLCPGIIDPITEMQCLVELHPKTMICPECGHRFVKEIATDLPKMADVTFETAPAPDPEWREIKSMYVDQHLSKKSGKSLLKVVIELRPKDGAIPALGFDKQGRVTDWICLPPVYSGFAAELGEEKFCSYMSRDYEFEEREEVAEYLWDATDGFRTPIRAKVQVQDNGWLELKDLEFEAEAGGFEQYVEENSETDVPLFLGDDSIPF